MDSDDFDLQSGDDTDEETGLDHLVDELYSDVEPEAARSEAERATDPEDSGFEWVSDELDADATDSRPETPSDAVGGAFDGMADEMYADDSDALDSLADQNHVLLLASRRSGRADEICVDLATATSAVDLNVLTVSATRTMDDLVDHWRTHNAVLPATLALVRVGGDSRGDQAASITTSAETSATLTVRRAPDPSDLTRLGITTTKALAEWETSDHRTAVCFHSITSLLQYVDSKRLFRFLHLLQNRIDRLDGVAHYHMDPTAHPAETIGVYRPLFDAVVDLTGDRVEVTIN